LEWGFTQARSPSYQATNSDKTLNCVHCKIHNSCIAQNTTQVKTVIEMQLTTVKITLFN